MGLQLGFMALTDHKAERYTSNRRAQVQTPSRSHRTLRRSTGLMMQRSKGWATKAKRNCKECRQRRQQSHAPRSSRKICSKTKMRRSKDLPYGLEQQAGHPAQLTIRRLD